MTSQITKVICRSLLLQCALVSGVVRLVKPLNVSTTARLLRNSTQAALASREALRADMDSKPSGDFETHIQACDRSPTSEKAVQRIGLHESASFKKKQDHQYYRDTWCALQFLGSGARTIVDVGSNVPPFLLSADWIPQREIVSKYFPGKERPCGMSTHCTLQDGIQASVQDFYEWQPKQTYDIALSMQVIEHVPNPTRFMRKLLKTGRKVVVTVPYRWDKEDKNHKVKQHNIMLQDMRKWAGKHELHWHVSQDGAEGKYSQRLLMVFEGDLPKTN